MSTRELMLEGSVCDLPVVARCKPTIVPPHRANRRRRRWAGDPGQKTEPPALPERLAEAFATPLVATERNAASGPAWLLSLPGWLLSLALHLMLILGLAVATFTQPTVPQTTVLAASIAVDQTPSVESFQVALPELEVPRRSLAATAAANMSLSRPDDLWGGEAAGGIIAKPHLVLPAGDEVGDPLPVADEALQGRGAPGAQFFGVQATGRRFVFVVDSSDSMRDGKLAVAKQELTYAIRRLSTDQSFYVLFFNHATAHMTFAPQAEPEQRDVPATLENILKFEEWLASVETDYDTRPYEAIRFALDLQPDAIYLLSDGEFTDRGQTVRFLTLTAKNRRQDSAEEKSAPTIVHTVAIWQLNAARQMKTIARQRGGTYRFIPRPREPKKKGR